LVRNFTTWGSQTKKPITGQFLFWFEIHILNKAILKADGIGNENDFNEIFLSKMWKRAGRQINYLYLSD